ncbi:hypothetical protein DERF_014970 [Dermatophagoides farinae]|uniref:Uncharacterized protein n=1 Tax=Dermatophagoides farinae TaxID=6954 RepID=A0A922KXR6_DERFA|nr:hypothetical protein DERF_014970 [Dermatophagoides farinae]
MNGCSSGDSNTNVANRMNQTIPIIPNQSNSPTILSTSVDPGHFSSEINENSSTIIVSFFVVDVLTIETMAILSTTLYA